MRCFTDGEIRRGVIAVWSADPEADLFEVFLLGAATTDATETTNDASQKALTRSDRVGVSIRETTQRSKG
jgi:hypothetical protein